MTRSRTPEKYRKDRGSPFQSKTGDNYRSDRRSRSRDYGRCKRRSRSRIYGRSGRQSWSRDNNRSNRRSRSRDYGRCKRRSRSRDYGRSERRSRSKDYGRCNSASRCRDYGRCIRASRCRDYGQCNRASRYRDYGRSDYQHRSYCPNLNGRTTVSSMYAAQIACGSVGFVAYNDCRYSSPPPKLDANRIPFIDDAKEPELDQNYLIPFKFNCPVGNKVQVTPRSRWRQQNISICSNQQQINLNDQTSQLQKPPENHLSSVNTQNVQKIKSQKIRPVAGNLSLKNMAKRARYMAKKGFF